GKYADVGVFRIERAAFFGVLYQVFVRKTTGDAERLGVIRQRDVLVPALASGFDHFFGRIFAVRPRRMHVKIAANILERDDIRQFALRRSFDLAPVLTQNRRNVRQPEFREDLLFLGASDGLIVRVEQSVFVQLETLFDGTLAHPDVVGLRAGEV